MATKKKSDAAFSAEELAAMKEHAKEVKASRNLKGEAKAKADADAVVAKIKEMADGDRQLAEQVHAIVTDTAPELAPRLWYGMPAYAKDGKVLCFFQDAAKFKARYSTLGFQDVASLDDGNLWPTSFALTEITAAEEKKIRALVKKAVK